MCPEDINHFHGMLRRAFFKGRKGCYGQIRMKILTSKISEEPASLGTSQSLEKTNGCCESEQWVQGSPVIPASLFSTEPFSRFIAQQAILANSYPNKHKINLLFHPPTALQISEENGNKP